MKKILFRKLLLDYMSFFLIALTSSTIIIWVFQAVNFLDIIIEDGRNYLIYLSYTLLNFPKIFSKLLPFILFFSLFYVTTKYEIKNEYIIYWNFGINKIQIINFIFKISVILMLLQIILTSLIVPNTQSLSRSLLRESSVNFIGNFIKPQRFNDTIKGITIYSEKKDESGNFYNLYIKKEIGKDNFQITYAKKGIFKEINNSNILVLYDGETINGKGNQITNFSFSKSDFPLINFETHTITKTKTQELSTQNIINCLKLFFKNKKKFQLTPERDLFEIENCSYKNLNNLYKEIYKRIFIPLYIPLLMLLPLFLITSSKENENYSKIKLFTFIAGLLFIIFSETTIRFISKNFLQNFVLGLIPVLILIILYSFYLRKFNFKK